MARDLTNIRFTRVALVDKGANLDKNTQDGAHILLWKRDSVEKTVRHEDGKWNLYTKDGSKKLGTHSTREEALAQERAIEANKSVEKDSPSVSQVHVDSVMGRPKEKNVKKSFWDIVKSFPSILGEKDEAKREQLLKEAEEAMKAAPIPGSPEHESQEMQHIQALHNLHKSIGAHLKAHGVTEGHGQVLDKIHKALHPMLKDAGCDMGEDGAMPDTHVPAEVTKRLTDVEKRNVELEKLLQDERNTRLDGQMVTLLKSFKATPFNTDEKDENNDIQKFRKMQNIDPNGFDRMVELFKAADAQLATQTFLRKNLGTSRSGNAGSAEARLMAKADAIIQKDGKLTKEQAFEQASLENPDLVTEYRREQQ